MPWITIMLVMFLVALVAAIKYLPWWGIVILFAIPLLTWRYVAAAIITHWVRRVAGEMAQVLVGATTEVHSIKPVPPPSEAEFKDMLSEGNDEDDEEFEESIKDMPDELPGARHWYELDVSIRPRPVADENQANPGWPPEGLMLIAPGGTWGEIDDLCLIGWVERREHGEFKPAGNLQSYGSERLRMLLGVKPGTRQLIFQYLTEQFGDVIELPPPFGGNRPRLSE